MKKVAIITTGGTIASKYNKEGRLIAGKMTGMELCEKLDLPEEIEIVIYSILQKPSMHMTLEDLEKLRETITAISQQNIFDGIVVTHGTDSLEETAFYLDITIDEPLPIVVTGSQRSPEQLASDADINLRQAIYAACDEQLWEIGTAVVFNERIYSARYVKKEHSYNIQGFTSFGFGHLGMIDKNQVILYQKPIQKEKHIPVRKEIPVVEIIKCYLGADGTAIKAFINAGVDGIILEGSGRGQVSPDQMPAIKEAITKGIYVVGTTAAEQGEVDTTYQYYGSAYDLDKSRVILGRDYDSKKARMKLIAVLRSEEDVASAFERTVRKSVFA